MTDFQVESYFINDIYFVIVFSGCLCSHVDSFIIDVFISTLLHYLGDHICAISSAPARTETWTYYGRCGICSSRHTTFNIPGTNMYKNQIKVGQGTIISHQIWYLTCFQIRVLKDKLTGQILKGKRYLHNYDNFCPFKNLTVNQLSKNVLGGLIHPDFEKDRLLVVFLYYHF